MIGLRWRFALGFEVEEREDTVVAAVLTVLLLLLVDDPLPLFEDNDIDSTQDDGAFDLSRDLVVGGMGEMIMGDEGGEVGAGDTIFVLCFFAFLLLTFSSSSEDGYDGKRPSFSVSWATAPNDGARFRLCFIPLGLLTLPL
jgi:hypothetical protein